MWNVRLSYRYRPREAGNYRLSVLAEKNPYCASLVSSHGKQTKCWLSNCVWNPFFHDSIGIWMNFPNFLKKTIWQSCPLNATIGQVHRSVKVAWSLTFSTLLPPFVQFFGSRIPKHTEDRGGQGYDGSRITPPLCVGPFWAGINTFTFGCGRVTRTASFIWNRGSESFTHTHPFCKTAELWKVPHLGDTCLVLDWFLDGMMQTALNKRI